MIGIGTEGIRQENGILYIRLPSRLDGKNAPEVARAVAAYMDPAPESIRIDAAELKYISADGLDVILALKRKCRDIVVENAHMGICDTLEAFGFNNFVEITKQYRFVSVKDHEVIGKGGHGAIYKISDDTIIKVYIDGSALDVIENERRFARNAFRNDIPTAIAYDVVQTEYGYGVMFEMLKGTTLGRYLAQHPEDLEKYSVKFADLLKKLNSTEADADLYPDFHDVYLNRIETAHQRGHTSQAVCDALKRVVLSIPRGTGMIHGDYHPNNVMMDGNGELMLIDMADISRGNGFFDIGGSYLVMHFIARIPLVRLLAKSITALPARDCLRMWDIVMRRYYGTEDEQLLKTRIRQFRALSNIRITTSLGMPSSRPPFLIKLLRLYTQYVVAPKADRYVELFSSTME